MVETVEHRDQVDLVEEAEGAVGDQRVGVEEEGGEQRQGEGCKGRGAREGLEVQGEKGGDFGLLLGVLVG